jgi:hypothetical protein
MELAMIMTIDNMGKRYGLLPSEVMNKATTFDLVILDAAIAFERDANRDPNTPPEVPEEDLLKILEKTRGN